jgi:ATP-dependent Zn protease
MQNLQSHEPSSEADSEVRFVRKRLEAWDRLKFLALFVVVWVAFVAVSVNNNPLESLSTAARLVSQNEWWLIILLVVEVVRQLNYLALEHSPGWFAYWNGAIVSRFSGIGREWDDWTRFRVTRVAKVILVLALLSVVLAAHYHQSPFVALFLAPAALINNLPTILQFALYMVLIIAQFAALFWFMSRGGVETYFPGDVKTRFSDVWGQDSVLEKIKENIIFLKDPEIIEERGGYVPGGILLWGPPGTGKTLMAEAVAGETENPFVFVDPGAFTSMFFGIGVLKVKGLFRKLRKLALRYGGVVVFMDEADTLGSRGNMAGVQSQFRNGMQGGALADLCHGLSYLSASSAEAVTRELLFERSSAEVEDRPRRHRYVFPGGGGMGGGSGSSSFDGTLQALLTELSGLKKPRGFFNRVVRRSLGLPPKSPPKYRMLIMMASNMPESLDQALLRPGRLDRIYKVGYPSKEGRVRTYMGYLSKVTHNLTEAEVDRLATITPYATGATIKDLVNEALINTIRDGREVITWPDVIKAKQLKELGPPEDVEYIHRERHAVAVHEACHAVTAARVRHHLAIDMATIEKGGTYLGMVSSIKPEDQFTSWRSEFEADIMVSVASLAGERLFFHGDNSSGVSGDLEAATVIASLMEAHWGMGSTISSQRAAQVLGFGGSGSNQRKAPGSKEESSRPRGLDDRVEAKLEELYNDVVRLLEENRAQVLAVAHALESNKTVTGEDIEAIVEYRKGPILDGRPYGDPEVQRELEEYHLAAVEAHRNHTNVAFVLPIVGAERMEKPAQMGEVDPQASVAWNRTDEFGGDHE